MRQLLILPFVLIAMAAVGQDLDMIQWSASYNEATSSIDINAEMKDDWVIYSQHTPPEGPLPLEFVFDNLAGFDLVGPVKELTEPIVSMSEMFGVEVIKFKKKAAFSQSVKKTDKEASAQLTVTFMTCDSKRCLPPRPITLEITF